MRVSHLAVLISATMANAAAASWSVSQLSPRDVSCPDQGNSVLVCSPLSSDTWYNGTTNQFLWNYNNPAFNNQFQNGSLSLYLYQYEKASIEYVMVKNFTQLPTTPGSLVTTVDDSWFPTKLSPGSANVTHTYFIYLIASDLDPATEMNNIYSIYRQESIGTLNFTVVQIAPLTTPSSSVSLSNSAAQPSSTTPQAAASTPSDGNSQQLSSSSSGSKLQPWTIGVIVAACIAVILAVIALIWTIRYTRRQRKFGHRRSFFLSDSKRSPGANDAGVVDAAAMTQGIIPGMQSHGGFDNRDVSSIHSGTPIFGGTSSRRSTALENSSAFGSTRGSGLRNSTGIDPEKNQSVISNAVRTSDLGQHAEARQSNSVLSSTDALMIADTFRSLMRKPDWNEKSDEVEMENTEENDEEKRKRLGNELLRQQLAEEGTQVQRIERRPTQLKSITTAEGKAIFENDDSQST
ncbi:unnamed protein product [Umbelopsis ramanniana]